MRGSNVIRRKVVLSLFLPALFLILFLSTRIVSAQGDNGLIILRWEEASVGMQIPLSISQAEGCSVGNLRIQTSATGVWRWIGIKVEPQRCRAVVMAKWEGELSQGPVFIRRAIQETGERDGVKVEAEGPKSAPGAAQDTLGWTYKTSEQRVFTYGYGGTRDKLTQLQHRLRFRYDGTRVMAISRWGQCWAST